MKWSAWMLLVGLAGSTGLAACSAEAEPSASPSVPRVPAGAASAAATQLDAGTVATWLVKDEIACAGTMDLPFTNPGALLTPSAARPLPPNVLLNRRWLLTCRFTTDPDSVVQADGDDMHRRVWEAMVGGLGGDTQVRATYSGAMLGPEAPHLSEYEYTVDSVTGRMTVWTVPRPDDDAASPDPERGGYWVLVQLIEVAAAD